MAHSSTSPPASKEPHHLLHTRQALGGESNNSHTLLTSENLANLPNRAYDGPQKPESVASDQTVVDERDETTGHPKNFGQMNMDQSMATPTMANLPSLKCPRCKSDLLVKVPGRDDWIIPDSVYETRQADTCRAIYPPHPSTDPIHIIEWLRDICADPLLSMRTREFPPATCAAFCAIFRRLQSARSSTRVLELGAHPGHGISADESRWMRQYLHALEWHFRQMVVRLMGILSIGDIPENHLENRNVHTNQSNEKELWKDLGNPIEHTSSGNEEEPANDLGNPIDHANQLDKSEPGVFFFVGRNPKPRVFTIEDVEPEDPPRNSNVHTSPSNEEEPGNDLGNPIDHTSPSNEEELGNNIGKPMDYTNQLVEPEPGVFFFVRKNPKPREITMGDVEPDDSPRNSVDRTSQSDEEGPENSPGNPQENMLTHQSDEEEPWNRFADPNDFIIRSQIIPEDYIETPIDFPERSNEEEEEDYLGNPKHLMISDDEEEPGDSLEDPMDLTMSSDEEAPQEFVGNWRVLEPTPEGDAGKSEHATGGKVRCSS